MNEQYSEMPGLQDRTLLFLHIPKTAGTSFRDLMGRRFSPHDTLSVGLEAKDLLQTLGTVITEFA